MASEKKRRQTAKAPAAKSSAALVHRLSASVTHYIFSFLRARELARGAFRVCKRWSAASDNGSLFAILELSHEDTSDATIVKLIQRAKGFLQRLWIGVPDVTPEAVLQALAANASPARFRSLTFSDCECLKSKVGDRKSVV